MKKNLKKNKQSNKGFTLVEVLVAILILAIIVVPLLNAFVVSANTNAKARRMMRATTLAQNVIEELKAYSLNESAEQYLGRKAGNYVIADAEKSYETVKYADGVHKQVTIDEYGEIVGRVDEQYDFVLQGVAQESAKFDVEIQVRKPEVKDPANLDGLGEYEMVNITSMNRSDCAYFAQESTSDLNVALEFARRGEIYTGSAEVSSEEFLDMMTRTITIDINSEVDGTENVKVTYDYLIPAGYTTADNREYTEYTTIYDNYASGEELQAVYVYYYPLYGVSTRDTFIINNANDFDVEVYLIKMKDTSYNAYDDANYKPYVYVNETELSEDSTSNLKICTNIKAANLLSFYNGTGASTALRLTDLGNAETIQNLYDITVRVYKHNDSAFITASGATEIKFDENDLISTFTGTVLDKAN